jgi:hypothetical protein
MSAIEQITSLLETMSFAEKLSLNERIATAIRKEGGKAGAKTSKKAKTDDGEAKPKRKAAAGTLAWQAFVKHIKTTQPDAFEGITKESDKLTIVKGIRAEDMPAYETFVTEWKANYEATQGEAAEVDDEVEEAEEVVAAPAKPAAAPKTPVTAAMTPAQKIAALKAAKAAAAPAAAPAPAKKEVKKAAKAEAKPAAKTAAKPKAAVKEEEAKQLPVLTIEDVAYWHDEETQGLWKKETETFSGDNWAGYYQPGNEEEPIRYTENFGDE